MLVAPLDDLLALWRCSDTHRAAAPSDDVSKASGLGYGKELARMPALRLQADMIMHRVPESLLAANVAFCRLYRDVPQEQPNPSKPPGRSSSIHIVGDSSYYGAMLTNISDPPLNHLKNGDRATLAEAVRQLECPGFAMKVANALGTPIEQAIEALPEKARELVQDATKRALEACLKVALSSLGKSKATESLDALHTATCTVTGAIGGFFGMYGLPIELPVSTAIILRSVADIARSEGEDLDDIDTKLSCLSVLALGARSTKDDNADIGYFAVRAALAKALPYTAERTVPPALARFIALIAERFGLMVSEKAVAEAVPVIGAVGGSAINLAFIHHFQDVAHGHFAVRRFEREYGEDIVRDAYGEIRRELKC